MRIEARDLTPAHRGSLVSVTDDTGESMTMTLESARSDGDSVHLAGRCLSIRRGVEVPPWEVLHIFEDDQQAREEQTVRELLAHVDRFPPMPPAPRCPVHGENGSMCIAFRDAEGTVVHWAHHPDAEPDDAEQLAAHEARMGGTL